MINQPETIITGSDFDSHIAGNDYLIVWPESDIDPRYGTYGFNKKKPQYPMIWSGNLHKRKDGLYYLNFTNEKFTGLTVWYPMMDGVLYKYYYIEGKPVLVQIYEK